MRDLTQIVERLHGLAMEQVEAHLKVARKPEQTFLDALSREVALRVPELGTDSDSEIWLSPSQLEDKADQYTAHSIIMACCRPHSTDRDQVDPFSLNLDAPQELVTLPFEQILVPLFARDARAFVSSFRTHLSEPFLRLWESSAAGFADVRLSDFEHDLFERHMTLLTEPRGRTLADVKRAAKEGVACDWDPNALLTRFVDEGLFEDLLGSALSDFRQIGLDLSPYVPASSS